MRAVTIADGELAVRDHDDPVPEHGEILVAVKAAGLNGADMLQRKGAYPAPPGRLRTSRAWSWRARWWPWGRARSGSPRATG